MTITVRSLRHSDFESVATIWFEGWQSTGVHLVKPVTQTELRERLPIEMQRGWEAYVALAPEIAAFVVLLENEVNQPFVSPEFQSKGIGKKLLDLSKEKRPDGFSLTTAVENVRACHFYAREGLRRGEISIHPRHGHRIVRYEWLPR